MRKFASALALVFTLVQGAVPTASAATPAYAITVKPAPTAPVITPMDDCARCY